MAEIYVQVMVMPWSSSRENLGGDKLRLLEQVTQKNYQGLPQGLQMVCCNDPMTLTSPNSGHLMAIKSSIVMAPREPLNHTQIKAHSFPVFFFDLPEVILRFSFLHKRFQVISLFIAKLCSIISPVFCNVHLSTSIML